MEESLNSEEVQVEIQRRLEEGRKRLNDEVAAQLEKEKEAAIIEAKLKEVCSNHLILQFIFLSSPNRHTKMILACGCTFITWTKPETIGKHFVTRLLILLRCRNKLVKRKKILKGCWRRTGGKWKKHREGKL